MANKNHLTKKILSTLFILAVSLAITVTIIIPTIKYINEIKIRIDETRQQSTAEYEKVRALKKSLVEISAIKQKMPELEKSFVKKEDSLNLIQELEDLAINKNVTQNLTLTPQSTANNFIFAFALSGSFENLLQYLHELESREYYIMIDSLNWNKIDENNVSLNFNGYIKIK
ncbi:MAG: hypothetical protein WC070_02700 [Candidatus Magasanikbacteria bacterium]